MFKNYLKISVRYLWKNKLYSLINIFGLGVAIAVSITGYINYQFSQSFDNFHIDKDNIHLLNTFRIVNNQRVNLASSPTLLAPAIVKTIPGIDKYSRLAAGNGIIRYDDKVFHEQIHYVDENFFEIFTFSLLKGNINALQDKSSLIITDEIALKYFGDEDPIGRQIILNPNGQKEYSYFVRAVIKKPPTNSSIVLNVCAPYERQADMLGYDLEVWNDWTSAAFIHTSKNSDKVMITEQLQEYVSIVNNANPQYLVEGFYLTTLPQLASASRELQNRQFRGGFHLSQIIAPSVIALLVLLLACFNFVNTAIAYAGGRLKEIGIRKVIGGRRIELIKQFMGENIILCLIALLLGAFLAEYFVRFYDTLFPDTSFSLNYSSNIGVFGFIAGIMLFTALAAGAYPAVYVSKFNPVTIFSGKQKLGGTNRLIRILLSVQFTISIAAILGGIILYKNGEFIKNYDLGFDKEQVIVIPVNGGKNYNILKNALSSHPDILNIGASEHLMGRSWTNRDIEVDNIKSRIMVLNIGEDYLKTSGIEISEGKVFDSDLKSDAQESILINETMAKTYGWADPVGKYIKFMAPSPGKEYRIVGVVKDFHMNGLWDKIKPLALRSTPPERYQYLLAKFDLPKLKQVSENMQQTWKRLFPHLPYAGFFQSDIIAETIQITDAIKLLSIYVAIIVLITTGLGLYALVSLNTIRRTKEIGIRRVLGADFTNIAFLISREFLILLIIGGIFGSLFGYFMVTALLSSIWAYYVDFGISPFLLATLMMVIIALLTISSRVITIATSNPVEAIRYE